MLLKALPFAISYGLIPLVAVAAYYGGWLIALPFLYGWILTSVLDKVMSIDTDNMDPTTQNSLLFWHKFVTWAWVPSQMVLILYVLWQITQPGHLGTWEAVATAGALGIATGGIGITFAHEMVHQRNKWERWAGELLLISTAYGHFATEHVFGHHINVGTPKDPVSARKGENFFSFFLRAVFGTLVSAWHIDRNRLAKRKRPVWHRTNPFWRYGLGLAAFLAIAYFLGGLWGMALFGIQAFVAILQLEAVNYVEHYGLQRRYLSTGKFERVQPHHSWNASQRVTNWMLINLQRHSDHHFRPDRRFPLLQHYSWKDAPQLPFGYAVMVSVALNPPLWFWMMNRRVDRWRETFYPGVTDWDAYDNGTIGQEPHHGDPVPA
ncbi:MAG: alkane 1-monooxygenase [Pseudomonadota bacterium]